MSEVKYCQNCRDTFAKWGEDPLQILCNNCYSTVQKQSEVVTLKGKSACINCMYWHPGQTTGSGQCRNSFSGYFKTLTSASENCTYFLSL